jgi:hypothetical protein
LGDRGAVRAAGRPARLWARFLREDGGLQPLEWSIVTLGIAVGALVLFQAFASLSEP